MSIKTELQSNNTDLQSLIDIANSLPEKENLDTELTTQDDLIAQIIAALEKKMVPSDVVTSTIEVEEGSASSYSEGTLYVVYEEA